MGFLGQQFHFPPVQELVQGVERILSDGTFIRVTPHLQTHQSHPNVKGPVELKGSMLTSRTSKCGERVWEIYRFTNEQDTLTGVYLSICNSLFCITFQFSK